MLCSLRLNRQILPKVARSFCTAKDNSIAVEVNDKTGIATVNLNRPPINALNLELLQNFKETIKQLEANKKLQGLILTSSNNRIFTSGLDITELYKPDPERLKQFYAAFQDTWLTLFSCQLPTAAIVNGHSPAGGCVYATSCEFRVMLPNFTIGLNEAQLGLVAPRYVTSTFCNVVSKRSAELALTQGKMFSTEEAFKAGLIDVIAETKEEGLKKCEDFIKSFKGVNREARAFTKLQFRERFIKEFKAERHDDLKVFVERVLAPNFQKQLEKYVESLKQKSKQKVNA